MFKKIENVAWLVLTLSFLIFLVLAIGTPLILRWYVRNYTRPLEVQLQPRARVVSLPQVGSFNDVLVQETTELKQEDQIKLSVNASAFLLFYKQTLGNTTLASETLPIITVELNGETQLRVENARSPRFARSTLPHQATLDIAYGANVRITVEGNGRDTRLDIRTPHGTIRMEEGTYVTVVDAARTEFNVTTGRAYVPDATTGDELVLTAMQRTELTQDGLGEIRVGARNIMRNRNGDFQLPLEEYWQVETSQSASEEPGTIWQFQGGEDAQIVRFERGGQSPSVTRISQTINQDIRGAQSLQVQARIRVSFQQLSVCGSLATECPLMLRIYFTDQNNTPRREWLQGFYTKPGEDSAFCVTCDWKATHIQVAQTGAWYNYESEDLLPLLRAQGIDPAIIESVEIYASGHAYDAAIDEIAILVGE